MSIINFEYGLAKAIQQDRLRQAEQARLVSQAAPKMWGNEFFFRGQPIFDPKQAGRLIYVIVEGEVAILHEGRCIERVGPGHCLVERDLSPRSGWLAVAHTNCRLTAINPLLRSILVQRPPEAVLRVLCLLLGGATQPEAGPQLRWPASLVARREARQHKRPREAARVFETVQKNETYTKGDE